MSIPVLSELRGNHQRFERLTDVILSSPSAEGAVPLVGEFVALAEAMIIRVNAAPYCQDAGQTNMGIALYVGEAADQPLLPVAFGGSPPAGTQVFQCGAATGQRPWAAFSVLVEGLTVGVEYAVELVPLILGAYWEYPTLDGPDAIEICRTRLPAPDYGFVGAIHSGPTLTAAPHYLDIWRFDHNQHAIGDQRIGTVDLPGNNWFCDIAFTPDGSKAVAVNPLDHTVYVIDTGAPQIRGAPWGTPALRDVYTVPGATPGPTSVVCVDNTYAWIVTGTTDRLIRLTLADGTMPSSGTNYWTVSATEGLSVACDEAGTHVFIADGAASTVRRVRLSDGAVTHTYTGTGTMRRVCGKNGKRVGTYLYVLKVGGTGGNQVVRLNSADLTGATAVNIASTDPQCLNVHDDERSFWVGDGSAVPTETVRQYQLPSGTAYHSSLGNSAGGNWPIFDMFLLPTGAVYWLSLNSDTFSVAPGGSWEHLPSVATAATKLEMTVEKAGAP